MVKKLFKHELLAYTRVLIPVYSIVLGFSVICRLIQVFETDSILFDILNGSAVFAYVVAVVVCLVAASIFSIVRFYKNLFTGEGYLSFTLPVTTNQHLWVKLLTAVLWDVVSLVTALVSACIITAGDLFTEIMKAAAYLWGQIPEHIGMHLVFYVLEFLCILLFATVYEHLLIYTCISAGQLFRKNRILAAVGVYYGLYIVLQVISTVATLFITVLGEAGVFDALGAFIEQHPLPTVHVVLCAAAVLFAGGAAICYAVTHHLISRRLNLE